MRFLALSIVFVAALALAACKGGQPAQTGPMGTLNLNISHTCGGAGLTGDTLKLDSLNRLKVSKFAYIISNVQLVKADGSTVPVTFPGQVIDGMANGGGTTLALKAPVGEYTAVRFYIGLDSATNHQAVANLEQTDPLNVPEMHWSWMPEAGYKFMALEGELYMPGQDSALAITYHLATDALYTPIELAQNSLVIAENQPAEVATLMELQLLFKDINLPAERNSESMSPPQVELAKKLAKNWPGMFIRITR